MKEPESMAEIHRIRLKHYEETKGMDTDKLIEYYNNKAQELLVAISKKQSKSRKIKYRKIA